MRERIETDIVIVGAGPAGLSAAIRLKQLAPDRDVIVIEKAAELGGHTLSGAVMDPVGLDELLPGWRDRRGFAATPVTRDRFHLLGRSADFEIPPSLIPPLMHTEGGLIVSLGDVVRWLGSEAEALGVQIFTMTAATEPLLDEAGEVIGIVTGDLGRDRSGAPKPGFAEGVEIAARYTLIAEGARGSLARALITRFGLAATCDPQKYGLGLKEVWQIAPDQHEPGRVDHYLGHPLSGAAAGGGFAYHAAEGRLFIGLVVHLDYADPTLSPFEEFQAFKRHPSIAARLEGASRLSYGARAIASGGWQSIPELAFPGGALIGCAAGFMNVPRLKAIHNAIRSGKAAAELVADALSSATAPRLIPGFRDRVLASGIGADLRPVRNTKPLWSRFGAIFGLALAGLDLWANQILRASPFGTLHHTSSDNAALRPLGEKPARTYPRPDGVLTFGRPESVYLANIAHDDDQPTHLRLTQPDIPVSVTLPKFGAEPAPHYCPAGVYEIVQEGGIPRFRIAAQNCIHCKTCDIKDPAQNIVWTPPEGGSGPNYTAM